MPQIERISLKITAEEAVHKFFLREMFFFFIRRRQGVLFDADFTFKASDFSDYLSEVQLAGTMGAYISNKNIKDNLEIVQNFFLKRDKLLKIKEPKEKLLEFSEIGSRDDKAFTIKNCQTEYINNAIRYLDISLMLCKEIDDKKRIANLELEKKIGSINTKSLFSYAPDHTFRLSFCNKLSIRPLESKERAVFSILMKHFNEVVTYSDICAAVGRQTHDRGYANDGIIELRKKLCEMSGNPETIITVGERESSYKLVY